MYAPAVTPRPITSSNLHTKKRGRSVDSSNSGGQGKKMLRLKLHHSSGQKDECLDVQGMAASELGIYLLTQSNREFRQLDQRGHQQTIMLALVRFRVPPPSQFQENKVKARSSVTGKLKMHCTKILSWLHTRNLCQDQDKISSLTAGKIYGPGCRVSSTS